MSDSNEPTMELGPRFLSGLVWGQIGMSGRTLITFVVSIVVARTLGADNFGVYVALATLTGMIIRITEMGIGTIFNKYIPELSTLQPGQCSYLVRKVLVFRALLLVFAAILLVAFSKPLTELIGTPDHPEYIPLVAVWVLVRGIMDSFLFILQAKLEMKRFATVEIAVSFFQLGGALLLTLTGMQVSDIVILMIAVNGIQLICYASAAGKIIRPESVAIDLIAIAKFSVVVWISGFMQYLRFKGIDVFLILYFLKDPSQVGFYEVAYAITMRGGYILLTSIDRLALPIYSESYARLGIDGLRSAWEFLTKISIYLALPALVFLVLHASDLIHILYSDAYSDSVGLIQVFAVFIGLTIFLSSETSEKLVLALDRPRLYLYIRVMGGLLNVCLNIVLIPRFGVIGAVWSTGITALLSTLIELFFARKLINARLPLRFILQIGLCILITVSWTLLFDNLNLAQITVMALVYGVMLTLLLLRFYQFSETEVSILSQFSPAAYNVLGKLKLIRIKNDSANTVGPDQLTATDDTSQR